MAPSRVPFGLDRAGPDWTDFGRSVASVVVAILVHTESPSRAASNATAARMGSVGPPVPSVMDAHMGRWAGTWARAPARGRVRVSAGISSK